MEEMTDPQEWFYKRVYRYLVERGIDPLDIPTLEQSVDEVDEAVDLATTEASDTMLGVMKAQASSLLVEWRTLAPEYEIKIHGVWGDALDLLEVFLVQTFSAGQRFLKHVQPDNPLLDVLTRLHARGCLTGFEILTLLKSGYPDGAHARWRTLHEIAVVASFLAEHGEKVAERYQLHEQVESYKEAIERRSHAKRLGQKPPSTNFIADLNKEKDRILRRYGKDFGDSYGWSAEALGNPKPHFADLERSVGMDHIRPYYRMASHNVHAAPKGITFKLGKLPGQDNILLAGPSMAGLGNPGHGAAISLQTVTATLLSERSNFERIVTIQVFQRLVSEIGDLFMTVHRSLEMASESS